MGKARRGTATVTLLVVTDQVEINDRQSACGIDLRADRRQFAQQNANSHSRRNEFQFTVEILAGNQSSEEIDPGQCELDDEQHGDSEQTVEMEYDH